MDAISDRYDFVHARSSMVSSQEAALYLPITCVLIVPQIEMDSFKLCSALSDSHSLNALLLEVMTLPKYKHHYVHNFSDITLQILFDAWRASMNVVLKHPLGCNNCRHTPSW